MAEALPDHRKRGMLHSIRFYRYNESETLMEKVITSWIWPSPAGGVHGAHLDTDEQTIQWFDEPGCACAGSDSVQSLTQFLEDGPGALTPPDDVLAEMRNSAEVILRQS
jgi:hypothetical protein